MGPDTPHKVRNARVASEAPIVPEIPHAIGRAVNERPKQTRRAETETMPMELTVYFGHNLLSAMLTIRESDDDAPLILIG